MTDVQEKEQQLTENVEGQEVPEEGKLYKRKGKDIGHKS
jgi:hypothetical protein